MQRDIVAEKSRENSKFDTSFFYVGKTDVICSGYCIRKMKDDVFFVALVISIYLLMKVRKQYIVRFKSSTVCTG